MTFSRCVLLLAVSLALADGTRSFAQPSLKNDQEPLPDGALWRLGTMRMRHLGAVRQVSFTHDGKQVASLGGDNVLSLWDLKTGSESRRFAYADKSLPAGMNAEQMEIMIMMARRGHVIMPVINTSGDISADGTSLILSTPGKVRVLDLVTGQETIKCVFKDGKAGLVAASANGKLLARYFLKEENARELAIVESAGGKEIHKLRLAPDDHLHLLCFSRDAKYLAAANTSNRISLWDVSTGKRIRSYHMNEAITALSFAPAGGRLASAGSEGVSFWDLATEEETAKLPIEEIPSCAIAFSPDGKRLATTGKDNSVLLWDIAKAEVRNQLGGLSAHVSALAFSADGKQLASGTADGRLHLWDLTTMQQNTPVEHRPSVKPIAFFGPNKLLVKSEPAGKLQHIDATQGKLLKVLTSPPAENKGVLAISPNGARSAQGEQENGIVQLWDNEKNVQTHKLEGHAALVMLMNFSLDGQYLATLGMDKNLRVWQANTGKQLHSLESSIAFAQERHHRHSFYPPQAGGVSTPQIVISHDKRFLAALGHDCAVAFVEMATGKERGRFQLGAAAISQLVLSPDGRLMATLSGDVVRVWDTFHGKLVNGFVNPDGEMKALAFAPSSKLLAAGSANGTVTIYDLVQDKQKRRFTGHRAAVNALMFAPDGGPLLSAGDDGILFFWDVHAPPLGEGIVAEPAESRLTALWEQLQHADPVEAYRAIDELLTHPASTVKLLRKTLKPAAAVDSALVQQLIGDLRSANYAVREKANYDLSRLDMQVVPALETVMRKNTSVETHRRLEKIIEALEAQKAAPNNLRAVRAVEVLERIGSANARAHLQALADGAPHACLTNAAKESLQRNP